MKLLLDTHLVLWWESNHPRLPKQTVQLIRKEADGVFVSRASLWEMAIKLSMGRLRVDLDKLSKNIEQGGFEWLDIKHEHLLAVAALPTFDDHRDPFDRLLVAQSLTEPLVLLTADATLARYGATVRVV
ncbi:MAG: PIN domain-containing protein [Gallionellales bacterium GWA2_60_18]|nr:MAG: PIN domain-containing protein [Gallionellales bacterium GWA2_60_18]